MNPWLLTIVVGYLLGSIPFGYLLVKSFMDQDIRSSGSGNIGATNVARSAKGLGAATLVLDLGKAVLAILFARHIAPGNYNMEVVAAVAAICGHIFPVWLGFRGGKGVSSALGVFILLAWPASVCMIAVFALVLLLQPHGLACIHRSRALVPGLRACVFRASPQQHYGRRLYLYPAADLRDAPPEHPPHAGRHGKPHRAEEGLRLSRIAVLGAGAWGTALAISLARRGGHQLTVWAHSPALAEQLAEHGENLPYLPGYTLPMDVQITSDLPGAIFEADVLLCVTPSQYLRETIAHIAPLLTPDQIILSASKGLEEGSHLRMTQVIGSITRNPCGVLSGPSFAQEVAAGLPTAMVIAANSSEITLAIQRNFSSPTLRLYTNDDVTGVELGGALKNVIALSSGVIHGLGLGSNTSAALITRGIAEITRLAVACGGRRQTLAGLAGIGDLVLTCTGSLSRNRSVGVELGKGRKLPEILAGMNGKVAEGIRSTAGALGLAARYGVEMPIAQQMDAILHRNRSPREAIKELMSRPGRDE